MHVVAGVDLDRKYSIHEIMDMYYRGYLKPIALEGYVVRTDVVDQTVSFVRWDESTFGRQETGVVAQSDMSADLEAMRQQLEQDHPMRRRTPQERVASMVLRLLDEAKKHGTIPGLSDEEIREITGMYWQTGQTQVTEEMVRRVVSHYLHQAQKSNREADSHRVTRDHQFA